jgi:hypothetical protein
MNTQVILTSPIPEKLQAFKFASLQNSPDSDTAYGYMHKIIHAPKPRSGETASSAHNSRGMRDDLFVGYALKNLPAITSLLGKMCLDDVAASTGVITADILTALWLHDKRTFAQAWVFTEEDRRRFEARGFTPNEL